MKCYFNPDFIGFSYILRHKKLPELFLKKNMQEVGRLLMIAGFVLAIIGFVLTNAKSLPWLGKLPGDFVIRKGNFTFYFPLATSLVLSLVLTFLLYLFRKK